MNNVFADKLNEHIAVMELLHTLQPEVDAVAAACLACLQQGGKLLLMGNGGSAADAQHIAAEFVGRFVTERRGLAAIALTTDTSILTAVGNDYGFERVFARQIEALAAPGDLLLAYSTSGNSGNVLAAVAAAKAMGCTTVGLTGESGGALLAEVDHCLRVPSTITARIQEAHAFIGHMLCEVGDQAIVATD